MTYVDANDSMDVMCSQFLETWACLSTAIDNMDMEVSTVHIGSSNKLTGKFHETHPTDIV